MNFKPGFGQITEAMVYQLARADEDAPFYLERTVWVDPTTGAACKKSAPNAEATTYHRPVNLTPKICLVYMALLAGRHSQTGQSRQSLQRIHEVTGIERRTIQYAIRFLVNKRLVYKEHVEGRGNVYTL